MGRPPPSSQMNHTRSLILIYKQALAWPCLARFPYLIPVSPLASMFFPFSRFFKSSSSSWTAVTWMAAPDVLLLLGLLLRAPSPSLLLLYILSACQPCLSFLLPCYWPFSSLLDQSGVLGRQSKQIYRVKQTQHKRIQHIFASLNKYSTHNEYSMHK